jgi:cysteinyl-tRNA synthetase
MMAEAPVLKLYNTLTREKAPFTPIDPANVRMYVCGPTVYDFAHIGNARPAIVFDVLFRLLRHVYGETHVKYVRNITDLDDKINARALRDFPGMELNAAIRLVTEKTEKQYRDDVAALGCLEPTVQPRATEYIAEMVTIIQQLLDRGHAYVATGGEGREVLFATGSMADYGQLSKRKLEDQQAGARVAVEAHKKNPGDFVLWKESAADQPGWPADFTFEGATTPIFGRPGWHIECSAMAGRHLGDVFDIHGGGLDLIFPHHENEIAQSRCAHGTDVMANIWMHNGFVQVEGRKMSKSEGNFVTIYELLHTEKFGGHRWTPEVVRWAMLSTDYREPIDFSIDRLWQSVKTFRNFAEILDPYLDTDTRANIDQEYGISGPSSNLIYLLTNNLWTSALTGHFELLMQQARGKFGNGLSMIGLFQMMTDLEFLGFDLAGWTKRQNAAQGIGEVNDGSSVLSEPTIELMLSKRLELLKSKNFAEADKIRDELLAKGIQLKDGKDPETGERVTTWEVKR